MPMTLVGAPSIEGEAGAAPRPPARLPGEPSRILASPHDLRSHGPTGGSKRVPSPARLRFLAPLAPPRIEGCRQPSTRGHRLRAAALHCHLLWWQALPHCVMHLWALRGLCLRSCMPVVGRTGSTRAGARMLRPIDALWLALRRLPGVALCQEKRPPTPEETRAAPVAGLACSGRALADNGCPRAGGTMPPLSKPGIPSQSWSLSPSHREYQINRAETPSDLYACWDGSHILRQNVDTSRQAF
jgi:hypothetical protein